jgi:nicotinamide-nucleotide amidase
MATDYVLPRLAERTGGRVIRSRVLRLCGIGESDAEAQLHDLIASENPTLAPLAKLGEVHFRITARADSPRTRRADDCRDGARSAHTARRVHLWHG